MQVLAINDDATLAAQLQRCLASRVDVLWLCDCVEQGLGLLKRQEVDLVLINARLSRQQPLLWRQCALPLVLLSAAANDETGNEQRLPANCRRLSLPLKDGALLKTMTQLLAMSERSSLPAGAAIERPCQCAMVPGPLLLTVTEQRLLAALMAARGQLLSKSVLYPQVLLRPYGRHDRSLDLHVSHLRGKLRDAGIQDEALQTVWGRGYMWLGPLLDVDQLGWGLQPGACPGCDH